jgi:hypothetical protein
MSHSCQHNFEKFIACRIRTNSVSASVCQHGSNVGGELFYGSFRLRDLEKSDVIAPTAHCDHDFGIGEFRSNG